jgi:hypothetical protein
MACHLSVASGIILLGLTYLILFVNAVQTHDEAASNPAVLIRRELAPAAK